MTDHHDPNREMPDAQSAPETEIEAIVSCNATSESETKIRPRDHFVNACLLTLALTMIHNTGALNTARYVGTPTEQYSPPETVRAGHEGAITSIACNLDEWRVRAFQAQPLPECRPKR